MGSCSISCPLLPSRTPITIVSWHGDCMRGLEERKNPFHPSFLLGGGMFTAFEAVSCDRRGQSRRSYPVGSDSEPALLSHLPFTTFSCSPLSAGEVPAIQKAGKTGGSGTRMRFQAVGPSILGALESHG